jgi:hypothetical protein
MANWIKGAIKSKGSLTRSAKAAGAKSPISYARQVASGKTKASALTKKRANLALTLSKFHK